MSLFILYEEIPKYGKFTVMRWYEKEKIVQQLPNTFD